MSACQPVLPIYVCGVCLFGIPILNKSFDSLAQICNEKGILRTARLGLIIISDGCRAAATATPSAAAHFTSLGHINGNMSTSKTAKLGK